MRCSRCEQGGMQADVVWLPCMHRPPAAAFRPHNRLDLLAAPACALQLACDLRANTPKDRRFLARHARALMPHTLPGWLVRGGGVNCSLAVAALRPPCCRFCRRCSAAFHPALFCVHAGRPSAASQPC